MAAERASNTITMRGEYMTRIETFVAAAFAFAVTMLVISLDEIPQTFDELVLACKHIPAFAASFAMLTWIWHSHANWSRWFGLQDNRAILLSSTMVFIVLVYVYPLRLIMEALFQSISGGFFPATMGFDEYWQARFMFGFYALGFLLLSLNFIALYRYPTGKVTELALSGVEVFDARTQMYRWTANAAMCLVSMGISAAAPIHYLGYAGYCFFLLFPILVGLRRWRSRQRGHRYGNAPPELG